MQALLYMHVFMLHFSVQPCNICIFSHVTRDTISNGIVTRQPERDGVCGIGWSRDSAGAWIITGGTQTGVMQFVGEAARDYMLQNGNYEQNLVVIGIAVLGRIANREAIRKGSFDIKEVETVRNWPQRPISDFAYCYGKSSVRP